MHKALVTGANGFIGSALTLRLLNDGIAVRAMCRTPQKGRLLAEAGAEVVGGDIQDREALAKYTQHCDVVFHVAAVTGSASYSYNVNVTGTQQVIEAAYKAGVDRFVHISSVAVYGYAVEGTVEESRPHSPSPHDFYSQSKSLGETAIWAYAHRSGLPTVSIRPAFVYGPGSGLWSRTLYEICRRFAMPLVNGGQGHAHPIFISDVVDLLITAATHPDAPGHTFHAAPNPAPSWADFLGYYARMAGTTRTVSLPQNALRPLAALLTELTHLTGKPLDVAGVLQFWDHRATYSMASAAAVLGWRPQINLKEGMGLTEPWLKQG
jgi:nucleoside-diphosphate-sugar epimerase